MNWIPGEYYQYIYLFLVTIFSISALSSFYINNNEENDWDNALLICTIIVLFLGTRPISSYYFGDMTLYYGYYKRWSGEFVFNWNTTNLLFDNLERFLASIRFSPILHYILFAGIYFGGILTACKKLFPYHITISFLCCCAAFSTFAACVNGYKAGSAASLFLVALAYRDNLRISLLMVLLSWGFHHSMQLPVAAFLITQFYNTPKYFIYFWGICALISFLHISFFQELFANLTDEGGKGYLDVLQNSKNFGGKGGFRFDFLLYSSMPILMGWWITMELKIEDLFYNKLLCLYTLVNAVWLLCMYASYTNRIAYLSWFMYPIVLIYPLFLEQLGEYRTDLIKKVVSLHLAFTIFMEVIYYA